MQKAALYIFLGSLLGACHHPPEDSNFVPVVGMGKGNKSLVRYIPSNVFESKMSPLLNSINEQVVSTLENKNEIQNVPWELTRVSVGLGFSSEFNFAEIFKAEIEANMELRFQKQAPNPQTI